MMMKAAFSSPKTVRRPWASICRDTTGVCSTGSRTTAPKETSPSRSRRRGSRVFSRRRISVHATIAGPLPGARKSLTSVCGQSVFRGTALPADARGDYFFCDPTIHVVRRAKIENQNGRLFFSNRYGQDEFMLSSDILYRPVNTATGPDGCLTVVDMYRGIIQDAPWLSEGPRKFIKDSGLGAQVQRGRIWRIRQRDLTPTAAPKMSAETTAQLVRHLENPNGWWRDTAQKLIILRADRESVAPQLTEMARSNANPLARLHALWTLEGMNRADPALLQALWRDADPRVRAAAIQICEPLFEKNDSAMLDAIAPAAVSESDGEVAKQIILSVAWATDPRAGTIIEKLTERFLAHEGVFLASTLALWKKETPLIARIKSGEAFNGIQDSAERAAAAARWTHGLAQWNRALVLPADMPKEQRALITKGEDTFFQICVSCHGADGKGTGIPGSNQLIAPALAGSVRVKGPTENLVPVLMNGLLGPIQGKTYQGQMMVPATALGITRDDRVAEVLSYIRYAWGNDAPAVSKDEVTQMRKACASRTTPWSDDELRQQAAK